jgi:Na+/proline symporter
MMAVMLAALTSDLTSIFNSASTLFTIDIWKRVKKQASSKEMLIVGRLFVVFMVAVSVLWIPIIENLQGGQLYIYIQSIAAALSPPIAAVYCLAICWTRMNERGAFWGLLVGFVSGVVRLVLEVVYPDPRCYEVDTRPAVIAKASLNFNFNTEFVLFDYGF